MSDTNEIVPANARELVVAEPSVGQLCKLAIESGGDRAVEMLERMMPIYERAQKIEAEKAFNRAFARFKEICPPIPRTGVSQFDRVDSNGVNRGKRRISSIDDILAAATEPMKQCGIFQRWGDAAVHPPLMTISCIVAHVDGHAIQASSTMPLDSSGGASSQQKYAIAESYCRRLSLVKVLGLRETDGGEILENEDAASEKITPAQVGEIKSALDKTHSDQDRFLKYMGVKRIEDITDFEKGMQLLRRKLADQSKPTFDADGIANLMDVAPAKGTKR